MFLLSVLCAHLTEVYGRVESLQKISCDDDLWHHSECVIDIPLVGG